jgi:uncharacterized membrane protein YhaH (DUF805 family)|tara:strand:- start:22 stop:402 length:381 start_codon:yes stop_codon:yes gene_type:complete
MKENSNNLVASIKRGIKDSFNFDGKSNRFEFITYFIFAVLFIYGSGLLLYQIIEYFVLPVMLDSLFFNFYLFLSFLMAISSLANGIRRINDLKMSRWSIILGFIPILGILFVVYLAIKKGEESFNS